MTALAGPEGAGEWGVRSTEVGGPIEVQVADADVVCVARARLGQVHLVHDDD